MFLYIISFLVLIAALLFFNRIYREINTYSELTNRHNAVFIAFQDLQTQVNNAAIMHPGLSEAYDTVTHGKLFYSDSTRVMQQLNILKALVRDSMNVRISKSLDKDIRQELPWLLNSNVPDSIILQKAPAHITVLERIDSLINEGTTRAALLVGHRKAQLHDEINRVRIWMIAFIIFFALLLFYTSWNLFRQQSKRKYQEQELGKSLQEISDYKYALDESSIVAITDQKGIIKHVNENFCRISKYSAGELIGQDHRIINSGYHPKDFIRNLWVTIAHGKIWKGELKNKAKDGSFYWVDTTIVPFLNEEGKPYQYVAIRADITGRKLIEENLQKSLRETADYKYALDESSIVAITDQKGIIKYVNANFCRISRYSADELIGQDHRIINSAYHPKEFIRNLWVTIANGQIWKGELKNKAKDGSYYWVDTTIVPFLNKEGKPFQYVAIRADITERKLAEENLQKSLRETADYKYALDESSIVAITDQKGIIKYVNANFCRISKYSVDELIDQDHRIINSGYHPKEFIRNLWVTIAHGKIWKGELKNRAKDGSIYWVDTTIVPFLDDQHKPYQYVAIRADITERKLAEEMLVKSESIYRTIASSIPGTVICLLDKDYRYLLIEGDMLEKLGYSKQELLGQRAKDVLNPVIFEDVKADFERAFRGTTINRQSTQAGYDIISRFVPLKNADGRVDAIMTVAIDVTELKNAQRDIAKLNQSLEEKVALRTQQLQQTNKELEDFSYSVSHDLRSPLRIIDGFSQMLKEDHAGKLDADGVDTINVIVRNARKMGQLIDDLLNFSKLGRAALNMTEVPMGTLVKEVLQELKTSGVTIPEKIIIHELGIAKGDPSLLKQVWMNLLSNAIKYSSNKTQPEITVGMTKRDGMHEYYVKDNGAGFNMQYADKLFGVFQRLHKETDFPGTGVGLALVKRIVLRHGGTIWAEAKEHEGAVFYFTLEAP